MCIVFTDETPTNALFAVTCAHHCDEGIKGQFYLQTASLVRSKSHSLFLVQ